jgi:hypothetical protein
MIVDSVHGQRVFRILFKREKREAFFPDRATREPKNGQARPPGSSFMLVRHLAHQRAKPFKTDAIAREADIFWIEFNEHLNCPGYPG